MRNPLSWLDIANVVYLEQPAGVGFSYSNSSSGYQTGDEKSAIDNYVFVQKFLDAYPEYVGRETWLAGESYGKCDPRLSREDVWLTQYCRQEASTCRRWRTRWAS